MNHLSEAGRRQMERKFEVESRLLAIMDIVVAEWESDPVSVQCFDLRIVDEAKKLTAERRTLPQF